MKLKTFKNQQRQKLALKTEQNNKLLARLIKEKTEIISTRMKKKLPPQLLQDVKRIEKTIMNNFMSTNLTTGVKWINSLKL